MTATVKIDLDDPAGYWETAIDCWSRGDEGRIHLLLADETMPVPQVARQWLARALAGNVPRKKGRPKAGLSATQQFLAWALFDYFPPDRKLPRTRQGYAEAARLLGVSPRTIEAFLPKTRKNVRGHKPYQHHRSTPHDPFKLTKTRNAG